jgi:tRNA threonylcarbamoyladenosine biosynthesis protein TsaE
MIREIESKSVNHTLAIGKAFGLRLSGGEVIELVGDLGAGKTVFVRGLATGIASRDRVQSPSFTISRIYRGKDLKICHFDFYRLSDPGILKDELQETLDDPRAVTVVEWGRIVTNVLPKSRLIVEIKPTSENSRLLVFKTSGSKYKGLIEGLK